MSHWLLRLLSLFNELKFILNYQKSLKFALIEKLKMSQIQCVSSRLKIHYC